MELAESITKLHDDLGVGAVKDESMAVETELSDNVNDWNSRIALILSKGFQLRDLSSDSAGDQPNVDRDRIACLTAANAIAPPEKQLRFYVARLQYEIPGSFGRWDQKKAVESATWHTIRGGPLGDGTSTPVNWTTDLHFLNPGNETLSQLWRNGEGEFVYRYERFAVVGWPKVVDIKNTHIFMGEAAAATSVFMDAPVDLTRLRMLLRYQANPYNPGSSINAPTSDQYGCTAQDLGNQATNRSAQTANKTVVSLAICENLCKAISESNEVLLVEVFFRRYFARLGQKRELVPFLAFIVRKFGWEGVSAPFVRALDTMSSSGCMGLALHLADELIDIPSVRTALVIIAVQKAGFAFGTSAGELMASSDMGLLWKHAMVCSNPQLFRDVGNLFARLEAKIIGPAVEALSQCVGASSLPEHRAVLATMASRRRQWLMDQVAQTEKPFAWEIVDMNFVGAAGMATFLDGPNTTYQVRCFQGIEEAHRRMALLQAKIIAPLKMIVGGRGRDAYVLVTKQAGKFTQRSQDLHKFKAEIHQLNRLLTVDSSQTGSAVSSVSSIHTDVVNENTSINVAGSSDGGHASDPRIAESSPSAVGTKRPREEPEVIVIE